MKLLDWETIMYKLVSEYPNLTGFEVFSWYYLKDNVRIEKVGPIKTVEYLIFLSYYKYRREPV